MKLMSDMDGEVKDNTEERRVYELSYLLVPTIATEDVAASYSSLKDMVTTFGGEFIADEMPKMIPLAYSMVKVVSNIRNKFNTGYFGWVKFTMDAAEVTKLKEKLDLDPSIIRLLITKTVKENTIALKKFPRADMAHRKPSFTKKTEDPEATPINKEEIDKEIDALIVQ